MDLEHRHNDITQHILMTGTKEIMGKNKLPPKRPKQKKNLLPW